jgi:hypothetical protein
MSAITARTELRPPKFSNAWRHDTTQSILAIVELGGHDAHLTFDSAADARAVAAECIKAAEAMERLEAS